MLLLLKTALDEVSLPAYCELESADEPEVKAERGRIEVCLVLRQLFPSLPEHAPYETHADWT